MDLIADIQLAELPARLHDFIQRLRPSPFPALLFLVFLPLWPLVPHHRARLFFTVLSILMIVVVARVPLSCGLLALILLAYFPIEWIAGLRRHRRLAMFVAWLALHAAGYACLHLPLPEPFANERIFRTADAPWLFVMISGIGLTILRLISHLFDRVTGRVRAMSYMDYLCYMVYFPQFRCLPLERGREFAPKLTRARQTWKPVDVGWGLARIALGFAALAAMPTLARRMPELLGTLQPDSALNPFAQPELLSTWQIVAIVHAIPVVIYGLLSGAASIQLGVSRAFGVRGSENTHYPFLTASPLELWRRWNITIFAWLRDCAYAPLGGGRRHKYLNIFLVFVYCGVLHTVQWRGLAWGIWTGGTLAAFVWALDQWRNRRRAQHRTETSPTSEQRPRGVGPAGALVLRITATLLTLEWAAIGAVILVDPDYCGWRLLAAYFARIGAALTAALP